MEATSQDPNFRSRTHTATGALLVLAATVVLCLSATRSAPAATSPPANDDFASAATLSADLPAITTGDSTGATQEAGEPGSQGTVWYSWTAAKTQDVTVETCGGVSYPPLATVYTGSSLPSLQRAPRRFETDFDSYCPLPNPSIDDKRDLYSFDGFRATAGQTYRIQVSDSSGGGSRIGVVVKPAEIFDLAVTVKASKRKVPAGGSVTAMVRITNRGNITAPTVQDPAISFGQELNVPGQPHYPGKGKYRSVRSPGGKCSKGTYGSTKVQTFACDVARLRPGESQTATVKVTAIKGNLLLDSHVAAGDDEKSNDDAAAVVRLKRRG